MSDRPIRRPRGPSATGRKAASTLAAALVLTAASGCTTGGGSVDLADLSEGIEAQVSEAADGESASKRSQAGSAPPSTSVSGSSASAYSEPRGQGSAGSRQTGGGSLFASLFTNQGTKGPQAASSSASRAQGSRGRGQDTGSSRLPGVDPDSIFDLGEAEDGDPDMVDDVMSLYRSASLRPGAGSSLGSYGLRVANNGVRTDCFPRKLVGLIKKVERRFNAKAIVTSGHRSATHNRLVGGAKRSEHIECNAADITVPNADRFEVARFVKRQPERGGVGTYCKNGIVHVDVGRKRSWHWDC